MAEKIIVSRKEAITKGFLEDRKVFLKPVPKRGNKMITDPTHTGYFMWEGAKKAYCLPLDKYGVLCNPFKDEEEMNYFSALLDIDLNPHKREDNFWHKFTVSVTKTPMFMSSGQEYDLSDPMDNIRIKILMMQGEIAESWDKRFERPQYKFAIVGEDYEEKVDSKDMEILKTIYTFWGSIESSVKKMREFLGVYLMHKRINKEIGNDATKEFLTSEIQKAITEDKELVYSLIKDESAPFKFFIYRGTSCGVIKKKGIGTYEIIGEEGEYNLTSLVDHLKFLKDTTDPIYMKMEAQINAKK